MSDRRDRAWKDYTRAFRESTWPSLVSSAIFVAVSENWSENSDPIAMTQAATEIGFCLLLGKPLLMVVPPGVTPRPALVKAAAYVLSDFDITDPACQERMRDALAYLDTLDTDSSAGE